MKDSFLLCTFCIAVACGDVNYDYMPETFVTWEKQINNFIFDEEKTNEAVGSNKVVLPHTFWVLKFDTSQQ